jgi:hypothetical protein
MSASDSTQLARELIETLQERGVRPANSLLLVAARASFCGLRGRQAEFEAALSKAVHEGWLEVSEDGEWLTLAPRPPEDLH